MLAFAGYIMRGHAQAILVALVAGILSVLLPPLSYIGGAALALVTLRKGALGGGTDVAITSLGMALVLPLLLEGSPWFGLWYALGLWLPIWILAIVLRRTISMSITLASAAGMGVMMVVAAYVMIADPAAWWRNTLEFFLQQAVQSGVEIPDMAAAKNVIETASEVMTGMVAAVVLGGYLFGIFLARWWQSLLFNPGGFRAEVLNLKLDRSGAIVVLAAMIATMVNLGGLGPMFTEIVVVLLFLCSIFGVALIHHIVERRKMSAMWLVALYILSIFLLPQVVIL